MLQNLLFCIPKVAVLHGKSVGFAAQKSRFRNVKAQLSLFNGIIFTNFFLFLPDTSGGYSTCLYSAQKIPTNSIESVCRDFIMLP
ncbi:hypothetical protein CBG55_06590 [Prevotella intermedia]|uniref:Uncharacterized protein n=1 Tax=Prevotella intermedia TaxID=28131 RepID=A0A2M8TP85_PREIN|nr:hypothetical protein CBG55_06590 [Prevotella intermedia]PJI25737.1 hypothetical protein CTM59_06655 [Prevotella intermedia]